MADIFDQTGIITNPPSIPSFGNGGQVYNADLFGGFNISAATENSVFDFRKGDGAVPFSRVLTNLEEAKKIGSTMEFVVTHVGIRVFKHVQAGGTIAPYSPAEVQAMKSLINESLIEIKYGSNGTKVGEFSGQHFLSPVDVMTEAAEGTTTATPISQNAGNCGANYIKLLYPIQIEKNLQIDATVKFGADVPTDLYPATPTDPPTFGFTVHLYGVKIVSA